MMGRDWMVMFMGKGKEPEGQWGQYSFLFF